ncbi:MAG: DUF1329 domain-containing protein [Acidobacteria bacterium]|nr:DUF1329 domain-containing protein [Acidobacteriota bacterium]
MHGTTQAKVLGAVVLLLGAATLGWAQLSPQEIARLGNDLTPLGGEKAGNADGSIPAWDGGITTPPAGYKPGMRHLDPYAADKVVVTITATNMAEYSAKLTEGNKAMLKAYPTFKMLVYPSHRSASAPQWIYDATKKSAATAKLAEGGNGVESTVNGIPFPIPKSGVEVIWNHLLRFRGEKSRRLFVQAAPTRGGSYTLVEFEEDFLALYSLKGMTEEKLANRILLFRQKVLAPARLAGGLLLVHESLNQIKKPRDAWVYNPGQRRVRRAPNVAYDNPGTASDGMRTSDNLDMFNGAPDRYNWKLVGKREMYVPYNAYKLHSGSLKYKEIFTPLHVNPDHLRYELHRVWVVDATLKEGARHIYKRRTFYVDEDSWQIVGVDTYDNRDQLWRVSEGHPINYYDVPTIWVTAETHTDLQAGRYLAYGLSNETAPFDFTADVKEADFAPDALRREGVR